MAKYIVTNTLWSGKARGVRQTTVEADSMSITEKDGSIGLMFRQGTQLVAVFYDWEAAWLDGEATEEYHEIPLQGNDE